MTIRPGNTAQIGSENTYPSGRYATLIWIRSIARQPNGNANSEAKKQPSDHGDGGELRPNHVETHAAVKYRLRERNGATATLPSRRARDQISLD